MLKFPVATKKNIIFAAMNYTGIIIGAAAFLIIGIFHPIVIKGEYHFGVGIWWIFLLSGVGLIVWALFAESVILSAILGITGFTCLWSIKELFEQRERVRKGWFPKNPKRRY
jgi:hypothetical protein